MLKLALFAVLIQTSIQWVGKDQVDQYFYSKPQVVPAFEKALHNIYIEVNKLNGNEPIFAKIYVSLIEDKFTFGGHDELIPLSQLHNQNDDCASFVAGNAYHKCEDDFFYLHTDMIDLQRTVFAEGSKFDRICADQAALKKPSLKNLKEKNDFVMKYGDRVLMMFIGDKKCIGTYDISTDVFSCMYNENGNSAKLQPRTFDNFLYTVDGKWNKPVGRVEIFCRLPLEFK